MAVGVPAVQTLEVEFTAGVWTDVTADWDAPGGPLAIHHGRQSRYSQPQPGSMTFQLDNHLGKYTPGRQVLADGVTAHPYWPNVLPRKRVRYSYTISAVKYVRFTGYIKGWPPALENGVRSIVSITATTRDDQLSRIRLDSPIRQEIRPDAPDLWWPLTDDAGATQAQTAPTVNSAAVLGLAGTGPALTFGDNGPGVGDGTGVKFAPASSGSGQCLVGALPAGLSLAGAYTIECFANVGTSMPSWATGGGNEYILALTAGPTSVLLGFFVASGVPSYFESAGQAGPGSIADGGWHHLAAVRTGGVVTVYIDGVSAGTFGGSVNATGAVLTVGDFATSGLSRFQGNVGQVAIWDTALSAARIAAHAATRAGYSGDTTDVRVTRYLGFGGLTSSDWTLDAGQTTVGTYPQAGKDVISGCQDMATTEGGVFWFRWDGQARFANRRYRDSTTPVLTLDATTDIDASVWDPDFSEIALVNTSTASRSAESGTLSTQTYTDTVSVAAYGEADGDVTTYTLSDSDALNLAQAQVAGNSQPAFRLNQIAVKLSAAPASLYVALAAVEIGSRIRITNLAPGAAPASTLDLFVEGWTETVDEGIYRWVADTSPVGAERFKLNATYGRLGCDGQTLNAALTNSATTVVIATAAGKPTFTTTGGQYPSSIKVGEEVITLNSAPGGATSPQTFTGCSRGQQGTTAAAQASGSVVSLWPATGLPL